MTPLAPHITAFLQKRLLEERQASVHTSDTYAYAFQLLFQFAAKQLKLEPCELFLEHLDVPLILSFLTHLEKERHNRASTRNARLAAIKSFMHYVQYRVPSILEQIRRVLEIPFQRTDTRLVRFLSRVETQSILDAPRPHTRDGIRDRAMLYLAFTGGLRVSELVALRVNDLTFRTPYVDIHVRGKGRKERALTLWKTVSEALRSWLAVRGDHSTPELFLNRRGEPLTRSGFEHILGKHVQSANESCLPLRAKRVSPHVLRHTCAINTLQATGDIRKVALWLGHESTQTTEIYLRADPTERLEIIEASVPPSLKPGTFRPPDKLLAMLRTQK